MKLSTFVARRYFLSGKKKNFINILSLISMAGVAIGTMALVVVLSVFNGLEDFIRNLYSSFDPQLKVVPIKGKSFMINDVPFEKLKGTPEIMNIIETIEDNAYVKYRDAEMVLTLKGVSDGFVKEERLKNHLVDGEIKLRDGDQNYAILGRGVQYTLNINSMDDYYPLQVFYPRRNNFSLSNPLSSINQANIMPAGVFAIEKQFDMNYIIVPLNFAEKVFDYTNRRTALEIKIFDWADSRAVKKKTSEIMGSNFMVLDSDEQHASLIKAIKIEKLFVYITFSFIIAVAAINIFFSLTMLVIDKRKDIAVLFALGANRRLIRNIFFREGVMIAFTGAITGLVLGIILCVVQQKFGIISLGIETSVINSYPVKMMPSDFLLIGTSIIFITVAFSIRPAILASKSEMIQYLN